MKKQIGLLIFILFLVACGEDAVEIVVTETAVSLPTIVSQITPVPVTETAVLPTPTSQEARVSIDAATTITATNEALYLPLVNVPDEATAIATETVAATATPMPTNTPVPTPTPTIDFTAVRQQLQANGQEMAHIKIGFHTSVGGNREGLGVWMRRLDDAGVPFFLKSVDDAGPLFEAQQLVQASGVPHTLVYRRSGNEYDVPNYDLPPDEAARQHWQLHRDIFPPELDPSVVWIETINEVDKNHAEWLGQFALKTAELALADGFRWAAFGWASGEPEIEHWQTPSMLAFLRLASEHPERLAIALHEYSFLTDDIADLYPYKVGRFQLFFDVLAQHNIPRPTVLITEWGWAYQDIPPISVALEHIAWAADLYAPYPEIRGAATWHLGCCFADVDDQTQKLIAPLTEYVLGNYFVLPQIEGEWGVDVERKRP